MVCIGMSLRRSAQPSGMRSCIKEDWRFKSSTERCIGKSTSCPCPSRHQKLLKLIMLTDVALYHIVVGLRYCNNLLISMFMYGGVR